MTISFLFAIFFFGWALIDLVAGAELDSKWLSFLVMMLMGFGYMDDIRHQEVKEKIETLEKQVEQLSLVKPVDIKK